jgi:hypothetical protein
MLTEVQTQIKALKYLQHLLIKQICHEYKKPQGGLGK